MSLNVLTQSKVGGTTWRLWATCSCISSVGVYHGKAWRFMSTLHTQKTASCVCLCVCVCPDQDVTLVHVCFVGWHIKRTVSEDRRHETKHAHRGPVWELPWYVGNAVCYDPLLMNVYQCCFSVSSRGDGHLPTIRETAGLLWKTRLWIFADSVHWTVWA